MAFEVLLEIDQSRKEVFITAETASATIKENLPSTDVLLAPFDKLGSEEKKAVYVLQKWSEKWSEYVDVKEVTELKDGDKLSVYLKKETSGGDKALIEWRKVRAEQLQDAAFQESLLEDQTKEEGVATAKRIVQLRGELKKMFSSSEPGSLQLAFRVPGGGRAAYSFKDSTTLQDLYGYVFACIGVDVPFCLYLAFPRKKIPPSAQSQKLSSKLRNHSLRVKVKKEFLTSC